MPSLDGGEMDGGRIWWYPSIPFGPLISTQENHNANSGTKYARNSLTVRKTIQKDIIQCHGISFIR